MKKISLLSLLLIAFLPLVLVLPGKAMAATEGYYTYIVSNGNATITDCDESISGAVTIPSTLGGCPVTSIGYDAFFKCSSITSISVPDSVTSIGASAFSRCSKLTAITIPDSVTSIGARAFGECSALQSVIIPDDVQTLSDSLFYKCSNLSSITIGTGLTRLDDTVFYDCYSLAQIHITDLSAWCNITFPRTVTGLPFERGAGLYLNGELITDLIIPSDVTTIRSNAFYGCDALKSVRFGGNVKSIESNAFDGCSNLESITILNGVQTIGNGVFSNCNKLKAVSIPASVTSIGLAAFRGVAVAGIWVDGNNANYSSDANGVLFNKNKTQLIQAPGAISGNYVIPNGVTDVCDYAFFYCFEITNVTLPESVMHIGEYAFFNCTSLQSINIPDNVVTIGYSAFGKCKSLQEIVIPAKVQTIESQVFWDCSGLKTITIPKSVTNIGSVAFYGCTNLSQVNYCGTSSQWSKINIGSNNDPLTKATRKYHSYESVVTAPTCTNGGFTTKTCTLCGDVTVTDQIAASGHSGDQWNVITPNTCTEAGIKERICTVCGETEQQTVPAAHTYGDYVQTQAPTCLDEGVQTRTCIVCSATEDKGIPPLRGPATVTVDKKIYPYPESSHDYASNTNQTKIFTCPGATSLTVTFSASSATESGYDKVYILDKSGKQIAMYSGSLANKVVTIPGDTFQIRLTSDGIINKWGYSFSSIVAQTDPDHTWSEWEQSKAPNCTDAGEDTRTCSYCNLRDNRIGAAATGHSYADTEVAPNCTEQGYTLHNCSVCGDSYQDSFVDPKGHSWSDWAESVAPSCTEAGKDTRSCGTCGESEERTVDALDHVTVIDAAVAPDCINTGLTEGSHCDRCGEVFAAQAVVPALGHNNAYTNNGDTHDYACSVCGTVEIDDQEHYYEGGKCVCGAEEPATTLDFVGVRRASSLLLEGVIYVRATVAFMNPEQTANTDLLTKEQVMENGRVLFWSEKNMPENWDDAIVGTENESSMLDDGAGVYQGVTEYWAYSHGIATKEYGDKVYFRTYIVIDGQEYYGEISEYSVVAYVENQMPKTSAAIVKIKPLMAAMLNYGAAAQTQFKYKTDALVNAPLQTYIDKGQLDAKYLYPAFSYDMLDVPAAPSAVMTVNFQKNGAAKTAGTLLLEGAIGVRMTFAYNLVNNKGTQLPAGTEATVYYWTAKDYAALEAKGEALSKTNASYTRTTADLKETYASKYGYEYQVVSEGIVAKSLGDALYIACIFEIDGVEYCSGVEVYSPEVYAKNQIDKATTASIAALQELCKRMVIYGDAAKTCLG